MQTLTKLSVVITARNDDYGGNLLNRIGTFIKVLAYFIERYELPSELIIVEYNPVSDKPRLSEVLPIDGASKFLSYRFIEVPESFHKKCPGSDKMPMLEFLAKNIGIRRAHGEYILSMNPDIIVSEELIAWLVKAQLDIHTYYRTNRHDITIIFFNPKLSVQEILKIARSHVFMVFLNNRTQYRSWFAWLKRVLVSRNKGSALMCPLFNKKNDGLDEEVVHERAAGDFLLMHRSLWEMVGGYDQEPITGFVDGYILYVLYCFGVKQAILPYPIYHINHQVGHADRPRIAAKMFREKIEKMLADKIPYKQRDENWGFPDEVFKESII
ncbi:MAG TPA: hypothetical protein VNF51_00775 [Candidatus Paceibacterota bacterium]|nr:hypothetical protein [Candidatus Paceibacterota bacterium]